MRSDTQGGDEDENWATSVYVRDGAPYQRREACRRYRQRSHIGGFHNANVEFLRERMEGCVDDGLSEGPEES